MSKLRGFLGEQSFEIAEGKELIERFCEAQVFGSAYKASIKQYSPVEARQMAESAVLSFRKTKRIELET